MTREVRREQFEITGSSAVTHVPSGMKLTKRQHRGLDVEYLPGAGEEMRSSGDSFDADEVIAMAELILREVRQQT